MTSMCLVYVLLTVTLPLALATNDAACPTASVGSCTVPAPAVGTDTSGSSLLQKRVVRERTRVAEDSELWDSAESSPGKGGKGGRGREPAANEETRLPNDAAEDERSTDVAAEDERSSDINPDCNFDEHLCGWTSVNDDAKAVYAWTRHHGATRTEGTGPDADHSGRGSYMFTESSSPINPHYHYVLLSPVLTAGKYGSLSFWYHMRGINIQELMVDYTNSLDVWQPDESMSIKLWMQVGDQGTDWHQAHVNIPATARQVRFYVMMANGNYGDVAVDDIRFSEEAHTADKDVEAGPVDHQFPGRAKIDALVGDKLLFTDGERINIINLDGSNATNLVIPAAGCPHTWGTTYDPRSRMKETKTQFGVPQYMSFDRVNDKLFWSDWIGGRAYRYGFNATLFAVPTGGGKVDPIVTSSYHSPPPGFPKGIPGCGKPKEATWTCPPSEIHAPTGDLPITHLWSPLGVAPDPLEEMLYFTDDDTRDGASPKIQRVSYDGKKVPVETVDVAEMTGSPLALNIDPRKAERRMYWVETAITDPRTGYLTTSYCEIRRANLPRATDADDDDEEDNDADDYYEESLAQRKTGARSKKAVSPEVLASYVSRGVAGFVLDLDYDRFYWADETGPNIQRCPLSGCPMHSSGIGSKPENVVKIYEEVPSGTSPRIKGIAVDGAAGKVYWAEDHSATFSRWRMGGYIKVANLDGSDVRELHRSKGTPFGVTIFRQFPPESTAEPETPAPTAAPTPALDPWGTVTEGECRLDRASGCLTSPDYPDAYQPRSTCMVKVDYGRAPQLEAVDWDLRNTRNRRRADYIKVDSSSYTARSSPPATGIKPKFKIQFEAPPSSPGSGYKGFKLCPMAATTTTTTTMEPATGSGIDSLGEGGTSEDWEVASGECTLDAEGCALTPNYPAAFPPNSDCVIVPKDGKMVMFELMDWDMGADDQLHMDDGTPYSHNRKPFSGFFTQTVKFHSGSQDEGNTGFRICVTMAFR